ncbi:MAG: hypothetical protein PGN13_14300 [Patulibacter minatonensis]
MTADPTEQERARAASVDGLLGELARQPVRPSRSITDRTLRSLRAERGLLTVAVGAGGTDRISEAAVARAVAREVSALDGVRQASVRIAGEQELRVVVEIVAVLDTPLVALADAVRAAARQAVEATAGRAPEVVDVHVHDVA